MELCKAAGRKQGEQVGMWWWVKEGIYLKGSRDTASIAAEADKNGMEE